MKRSDRALEEELWDDSASDHPLVYHRGCGGRIFWIAGDEWRCLQCCAQVQHEDMVIEDNEVL